MGEIADALRRAAADRTHGGEGEPETAPPPETEAPARNVYAESARQFADDHPDAELLEAIASESEDVVSLHHRGEDARAAQGVLVDGGGAVTEACLQLGLRLRAALSARGSRSVAMVSALRNEGKTTVSCNLALALASLSQGRNVALVDLDLRRPSVCQVLEIDPPEVGIEEVLAGRAKLEQATVSVANPKLDVILPLAAQPRAHELLIQPGLARTLRDLESRYEIVVFDTPPALIVPDSTILLQHDCCWAPVARVGITRARAYTSLLETLPPDRMVGGVLNAGGTILKPKNYYYYETGPEDDDQDDPER